MISPAQAKLIERELELARRGFGWEKIRSAVRFRRVSQGTEITVRSQDRYTSYELAGEAARRFRSVKQERELTKNPPPIKPWSEVDPAMLDDAGTLDRMLAGQARETGIPDFLAVPSQAAAGNAAAAALLADADFKRRFARYQELSSILGLDGAPGEPFSPSLPLLVEPQPASRPNPDMPRILAPAGQFTGIVLGLILGFRFGRKSIEASGENPALPPTTSPSKTPGTPDDW